jgi:hypothetical protein
MHGARMGPRGPRPETCRFDRSRRRWRCERQGGGYVEQGAEPRGPAKGRQESE